MLVPRRRSSALGVEVVTACADDVHRGHVTITGIPAALQPAHGPAQHRGVPGWLRVVDHVLITRIAARSSDVDPTALLSRPSAHSLTDVPAAASRSTRRPAARARRRTAGRRAALDSSSSGGSRGSGPRGSSAAGARGALAGSRARARPGSFLSPSDGLRIEERPQVDPPARPAPPASRAHRRAARRSDWQHAGLRGGPRCRTGGLRKHRRRAERESDGGDLLAGGPADVQGVAEDHDALLHLYRPGTPPL